MSGQHNTDFLDLIYDTALDPSLWVPVMERLADMTGGAGGWLAQLSTEDGTGCSPNDPLARVDPSWAERYNEHFAQCNPLHPVGNPREYMRGWTPCILTDEDFAAKDDLVRTEFYNDFWRPQDIDAALMIRLAVRGTEVATLNISRPGCRGQFNRQDIEVVEHYHPHLIRAYDLGRRLAAIREHASDLASALDRSLHGLFLLANDGSLLHLNKVGAALVAEHGGLLRERRPTRRRECI